jgi:hypothetical protein
MAQYLAAVASLRNETDDHRRCFATLSGVEIRLQDGLSKSPPKPPDGQGPSVDRGTRLGVKLGQRSNITESAQEVPIAVRPGRGQIRFETEASSLLLYVALSAKVPRRSIGRGACDAIASNFTK